MFVIGGGIMSDNMNVELNDDMMAVATGGMEGMDNDSPKFNVGDTVRFRDSDESGKQEIRVGHVVEVTNDNDGWGYRYKTDSSDNVISEINLRPV